jgi:hypothetical protein
MDTLPKVVLAVVAIIGAWLAGLDKLAHELYRLLVLDPSGWIALALIVLVITLLFQSKKAVYH